MKKLTWISISVRKVYEPEGDEAKARTKRIIADSIIYHIIPHVSSLKTPKGSVLFYEEAIEVASQDHGSHSFKECVPKGSYYLY